MVGKVFKYGDNVNTDVIIPARYLNAFDDATLRAHCMEDIDKSFSKTVEQGDVIVGGENFGSGSSREHAPRAIKASGIVAVIAPTFARIFYRNSINIGLMLIESAEIALKANNSDVINIDFDKCIITNVTQNETYSIPVLPDYIKKIADCGGLTNAVKEGLI
jgi:3-isopropylmalate dehydratase, small subunit